MTTERLRTTLWLSMVFNLGAALIFVFPQTGIGQFLGLPMEPDPIYQLMTAYFVALFGVCYGWLARQDVIVRSLLFLGIAGKLGVFSLALLLLLTQQLAVTLFLVACIDLTFATLWLVWLRGASGE